MLRALIRLPNLLVACAFAVSATGVAAPVPATGTAANAPSAAASSGLAAGKRMHKPYTLSAESTAPMASRPCAATKGREVNGVVSDPEEGGQVAIGAKASGNPSLQSNVADKMDQNKPVVVGSSAQGPGCR